MYSPASAGGSDTLCPLGPGLVTDWDFHGKYLRTYVNGEVVQDGSTDEMEWDMHYLVADIARTITLHPGDVLLSGTPANSRPVQPGDIVEVEVEGLGRLTNHIVTGPTSIRTDVEPSPPNRKRSCPPRSAATGSSAVSGTPSADAHRRRNRTRPAATAPGAVLHLSVPCGRAGERPPCVYGPVGSHP
ncbi:hypothetical protein GCM10023084_72400 [Streptomyces lacrimifluminis]|uniref:Fumarylacetoacetase-like C-terminal domain-containing protein n=1 Tax=Streptomyces lacrimifluminis TaxID=1500077 RepID=A0A917UKK4_9ACTN|nr:hypothetical protein GCM10012282_70480 [Streptomyces lacrimifluminis]